MTKAGTDSDWINAAQIVMSDADDKAMHIKDIEHEIFRRQLVTRAPSMPLEILLHKEAAMGRRFTKPDGLNTGYFSLRPPSVGSTSVLLSPNESSDHQNNEVPASKELTVNEKYAIKYKSLKKTCKRMIYLNAALHDEITRIDTKAARISSERRQLLKRVMIHQNIPEPADPIPKTSSEPVDNKTSGELTVKKIKSSKKKHHLNPASAVSDNPSPSSESGALIIADVSNSPAPKQVPISNPAPVTPGTSKSRKTIKIPPIDLDNNGRPILPIELGGGLTIYSIGEISESSAYCCPSSIFPVGYCCTRLYSSLSNIAEKCLYTCKVSEGPSGPQFEISPDNEPGRVLVDVTPSGCHNKLMQLIRQRISHELPMTVESDFFGLKNPIVKNLLQCCPGARRSIGYHWCKFEVTKDSSSWLPIASEYDPTTSFKALMKLVGLCKPAKSSQKRKIPQP